MTGDPNAQASETAPAPLSYWLYVSRSGDTVDSDAIGQIVSVSQPKNARLSVTGALMFTGTQFAQYIEGPAESVELLRTDILRDPRHDRVRTIGEGSADARKFDGWSLAYSGEAEPFEKLIALARQLQDSGESLLMEMIGRFANQAAPAGK